VTAYGLLFDYAPFYHEAPQVQKFIADCYRDMGDPEKAFEARQKIFLQFQAGSLWWNQNPDEKIRLQAYKLGEQALRENVSDLVKKAEVLKNEVLYQQAADMAQAYLRAYPEDLNALLVRWNRALILDSKLRRYSEALQEYLTISMVYDTEAYQAFARDKGLATLQDAALNAIVVADTLVQREYKLTGWQSERQAGGTAKKGEKEPAPLTETEKWLVMAYDNFIKLFPFEAKTSVVLANAGALYYTHDQFNEALRYFRTLTKTFPESEQAKNVQLYILESYFGKGDFESAEALSKKLLAESLSDQDKKAVQKRLAEAIFMRAKAFSDQNESGRAAAEFYRMALEVPTAEFADRAVFNAGREFEKARDYASAIRAYELLRVSYGGSNLNRDGLNNLAVNYAAMGDSLNAAARYEELSRISKDSTEAEAALTNAFVYYNHAGSWKRAVETGKTFSSLYPRSFNGPMVWLKTAEAVVHLNDDLYGAHQYNDLAVRFPQSPLGVEAYFRAGRLYQKNDSLLAAEKAFYHAYACHEALAQKGLPGNAFFASEGLYQSSLFLEKRYEAVSLVLPQQNFSRNLDEKQRMLRQLVENYAGVSAFQTHRMPEALFRIGRVNEQFAETWASQELPKLEPTLMAIKQKEINEQTVRLTRQALSAYLAASGAMSRRIQNADSLKGSALPDTVKALIQAWLEKAESKASEQVFRTAEISAATFRELLNAPVPADLGEMARLEYRSQVLIKAVLPLAMTTVEAHKRNLAMSDSLGIGGGWADSSRVRILTSTGFLPAEFEKLAFSALGGYRRRMTRVRSDARKEAEGLAIETTNAMMNFLELAKTYSSQALKFRKTELIQAFQLGLLLPGIQTEERAASKFALGVDDSLGALKRLCDEDREWAGRLFETKNDPKVEEWLAVFEDNVFFIGETQKSVLEQAHAVLSGLPEPSPEGVRVAVRLVQEAPDVYAAKLNMPLENVVLEPDSTWMWSMLEHPGWEKTDFKAVNWFRFSGTFGGDSILSKKAATSAGVGPFHGGDSTHASPNSGSGRLFIRKTFALGGIPVSVNAEPPDSTCRYYVNGLLMPVDPKPEPVLKALHRGENSFAFQCPGFLKVRFAVRFIPDRLLPKE
jgi:tetratricopeptide (TPR) repeat protein